MPTSQFPNSTGSSAGTSGTPASPRTPTDTSTTGTSGTPGSSSGGTNTGSGSYGAGTTTPRTGTATPRSTTSASQGGTSTPDLQRDANEVLDEAKSVAGKVTEEAQAQAGHLAEQARAQVAAATDHVKGLAGEQKDFLAGQIGGVADAMDRVASDLEGNNAQSARYARVIADNAEKLSDVVRDKDVDQLMAMAQDFGRRQPVVFVGAALLLGFAASRFLAASAHRASAPAATGITTSAGSYTAGNYAKPAPSTTGYASSGTTASPTGRPSGTGDL